MVNPERKSVDPEILKAEECMFSLQRRVHRGEISTTLALALHEATSAYIVASTKSAKASQGNFASPFRFFQRFFSK